MKTVFALVVLSILSFGAQASETASVTSEDNVITLDNGDRYIVEDGAINEGDDVIIADDGALINKDTGEEIEAEQE